MTKTLCILLTLLGLTGFIYAENDFTPADQSLLFLPTAFTMEKGSSALTNFELAIFQYSYAITNRAHLSAAMVFPFHEEMIKTITVGAKVNYLQMDKLNSAINLTFNPHFRVLNIGNVVSYGDMDSSINCNIGITSQAEEVLTDNDDDSLIYGGIGYIHSTSERVSLICEFDGGSSLKDPELETLVALGIRFKGKWISWDLGGFRPTSEDVDDLIAIPFIKATALF
ncbi:MAG TPA: hypothetical protein PLX77_03645 [Candidatus Cloacimonadota bacterium]|nr:hypothetical protein [Candidatus Cloacimonadota bacterium]